MISPVPIWIVETNAAAGDGGEKLKTRLSARLLQRDGPLPAPDDVNWLDLIIFAHDEASERQQHTYAEVMLDWLDDFQHAFGRTKIGAEGVTLACSALSFWEARMDTFSKDQSRHVRIFLSGYLGQQRSFAILPQPLHGASHEDIYTQVRRLYYTYPGPEGISTTTLLSRWFPISTDTDRSTIEGVLKNNRLILENLTRHHPYSVSYVLVCEFFNQTAAFQNGIERLRFLEQTFTTMRLEEAWYEQAGGAASPQQTFFSELLENFQTDNFTDIAETLTFLDQIAWLVADQDGIFAKWQDKQKNRVVEEQIIIQEAENSKMGSLGSFLQMHDDSKAKHSFRTKFAMLLEGLNLSQLLAISQGKDKAATEFGKTLRNLLKFFMPKRSGKNIACSSDEIGATD